jgi:hypothetical protein
MDIKGTGVMPMVEVENKGEMKPFKAEEISPAGREDEGEDWKLVVYPKMGRKKSTEKHLRTPPAWKKADQTNVATKKGWDEAKKERASSTAMKVEVVYKPSKVARALELKASANKYIGCIEERASRKAMKVEVVYKPSKVARGLELKASVNKDISCIKNEPMNSNNTKRLVQTKAKAVDQEGAANPDRQMIKEGNTSKATEKGQEAATKDMKRLVKAKATAWDQEMVDTPAGQKDQEEDWKLVVYPKKGRKNTMEKLPRTKPVWEKGDQTNFATKRVWYKAKKERASRKDMKVSMIKEPMKSDNIECHVQGKAKAVDQEELDTLSEQKVKELNTSMATKTGQEAAAKDDNEKMKGNDIWDSFVS